MVESLLCHELVSSSDQSKDWRKLANVLSKAACQEAACRVDLPLLLLRSIDMAAEETTK